MPKIVLFSMAMEMTDKPIEPIAGMRFKSSGGSTVHCPVVTMFCDSKEHLVERLTALADSLWSTADTTPIPMKEPT